MTLSSVRGQRPKKLLNVSRLAHDIGSMLICPKVSQEGIPEWNVLFRCMKVLVAKATGRKAASTYSNVYNDVRHTSMMAQTSHAARKPKYVLTAELVEALRGPVNTRKRKATYAEVACHVSRAGGQVWATALEATNASIAICK